MKHPGLKSPATQRDVGAAAIGIGVIVLFLLLFWLYCVFVGRPSWLGMTDSQYIKKMAAESNGDFSKLSKADQDHVNRLTYGKGAEVFGIMSHRSPTGNGGAPAGGPGRP
jgi:hypothetical protein